MARDRDIPQPRAVEKRRDLALARRRADALDFRLREDHPARAVVRVLDLDQRRRRIDDMVAGLARGDERLRREHAARADLGELDARVRCPRARLVPDRMAFRTDDDVVARPREHAQRDLIGHRSRRQPKRGLLAQQAGYAPLQLVRGRILPVLIVAHRRDGHRLAHGGRRPGDGIRAKVDRGLVRLNHQVSPRYCSIA